jgi:hypothetical protein
MTITTDHSSEEFEEQAVAGVSDLATAADRADISWDSSRNFTPHDRVTRWLHASKISYDWPGHDSYHAIDNKDRKLIIASCVMR